MLNILLIRFSALGDVAMLAPIAREYALQQPDDTITVLSKPFHAPLFENLAPNIRFIGADIKKDYKGIKGLYKLFKELHQMHFDVICDMHDVLRTKFLRKLFRIHGYEVHKINKHRRMRKMITAPYPKKKLIQLPTSFDNYRQVLNELRIKKEELRFKGAELRIKNEELRFKDEELRIKNEENSKLTIGIAPFAAHQGKIYPVEKMERVIQLITERRPDSSIYLFGGGGKEMEIMQQWEEKYPNVITAARYIKENVSEAQKASSPLANELRLMSQLNVMLSMDSANMHLASLVNTRVVSIWGATHPCAGFMGWQQSADDCIQRSDLNCRPCSIYGNKPCLRGDMECMEIKPEEIVERVVKCI